MDGLSQIGAPGVYELQDEPLRALTGERMDVCAFAGVAPRGPARIPQFRLERAGVSGAVPRRIRTLPVAVESWTEFVDRFGAFEGPGLLPYAVASFFENGGQRAYVSRIVHDYRGAASPIPGGVARAAFESLRVRGGQPVAVRARDEGQWGNRLAVRLSLKARPIALVLASATLRALALHARDELEVGALLRLQLTEEWFELRYVTAVLTEWDAQSGTVVKRVELESALRSVPVGAEVVEGSLTIDDGDRRREAHDHLGLAFEHPRWFGRVLIEDSALLYPDERTDKDWTTDTLEVPLELGAFETADFEGGEDRYEDIVPEDFFSDWIPGDEIPGDGVHAFAQLAEVALLCVPDLYSPKPLADVESILDHPAGSDHFTCCLELPNQEQAQPVPDLAGLRIDPAADLARITALQQELVRFANSQRSFVVLLDVPPGLSQSKIGQWRSSFASPFAAAYHPWLDVSRSDDQRDALIRVNPSAIAAGIIAKRERERGIAFGPANTLALGAIRAADRVSHARHDELHPLGINVYTKARDGFLLSAARTLSLDPSFRQLSVRRLITMLERALERQMQWTVFEPNTSSLRRSLTLMIRTFLRQLLEAGALQGTREDEAFFVRCDDELNPPRVSDLGQLIVEVGVAPAEPLEFIVLIIRRDGDGTLRIGEQ